MEINYRARYSLRNKACLDCIQVIAHANFYQQALNQIHMIKSLCVQSSVCQLSLVLLTAQVKRYLKYAAKQLAFIRDSNYFSMRAIFFLPQHFPVYKSACTESTLVDRYGH